MLAPQRKQVIIHTPDELILVEMQINLPVFFNNILKMPLPTAMKTALSTLQQPNKEKVIITFNKSG